ncbi:MAG TPA: polysaccharide biosynthesis tyrosine autokinase [Thermosynechococcaceae cyanobacterium]
MTQAPQRSWLPQANSAQAGTDDEGGLNLGQVVSTLRRKALIIAGVTTLVASAALLKSLNSKPTYQANFEILTRPVTVETQVISSVPQTLSNREGQAQEKGVDPTKLKLLKSPRILVPIAKKLESRYPGISYDEIAAGLVVTPLPQGEILAVGYQDKNAEKVKAILDEVADAYLKYSLEERLADVRQGIEFVDTQLPQLQKRVEGVQDDLQALRQQYNLIDPDSQGKQLSDQTAKVGQQRFETQVKLNEIRVLYQSLSQELARQDDAVTSSALSDNARYQKLLNQILEVEAQTAKDSSIFRDSSPNIRVLQDQQKNLLPLLQREVERVQSELAGKIQELEARNQFLAQTETDLNQSIKQLSSVSRRYTDIQRELKIATDNLNQFLTKREALRIDEGQKKTPWQILTPPTNPTPSSADVNRDVLLGTILGLLLGVGVALLLDKLSNVLHSADEIKAVSKLPILGVIPHNAELTKTEQPLVSIARLTGLTRISGLVHRMQDRLSLSAGKGNGSTAHLYGTSVFLEAFRSLYTNILLLSPDERIRSIIISSSMSGEGKSTISVYLAQAAAALGNRVLLVDADLRLPKLHQRLEMDNTFGLSTVIAENLEFERVVQKSFLDDNLFILTSGQIPPDPTRLLSSKKMQALIERFREAYDLVIYDMPPIVGLADAKLLAPKVDGIVMVVGLDKLKVSTLTQTMEELRLSAVPLLGIIANGSRDQEIKQDAYHQHYHTRVNKLAPTIAGTRSKLSGD